MKTETQLVPYNLEAATVEALKTKYMDVTIPPDDKSAYAMVMAGLRECREIRLAVDAWHKERKEWIVKAGKHYDAERRRVHALVAPVEDHLTAARKGEDDRKEAIKAEAERKERDRVEGIRAKIETIQKTINLVHGKSAEEIGRIVDNLSTIQVDEYYQEFQEQARKALTMVLDEVKAAYATQTLIEKEDADRRIEAIRLEKIRQEQEAEREKARKEREALEAERHKIEAEKRAIEIAKIAEQERQARAEFERRTQAEAKAKAEAEAKEKVEREAKEAAERAEKERVEKERQEALRPDKEKLIAYGNALLAVVEPELKNKIAKKIRIQALKRLQDLVAEMKAQAEAL